MAWLAVGSNNQDLCDKLIQNEVLRGNDITRAFRLTDRGDFVQQKYRQEAYFDRPFKRDHVHISAPHMYVTVLNALNLQPGQAFLNIGSGSGYLSCLAATLLGEGGVSHGIDVNAAVVSHSNECCRRWYSNLLASRSNEDDGGDVPIISREGVEFVVGNCFELDIKFAEKHCHYDRIYIGAGCPSKQIEYFYDLLADDGILVVPADDTNELLKIHRIKGSVITRTSISQVHFAPLIQPVAPPTVEVMDTNTNVEGNGDAAASVVMSNKALVQLPKVLWTTTTSRHRQFPIAFRNVVRTIVFGRPNFTDTSPGSFHGYLPTHVWTEIFTYCARDWFVPYRSPLQLALDELSAERSLRLSVEEKLRASESLRIAAERERELFRLIIARMRDDQEREARPATTRILARSSIANAIARLAGANARPNENQTVVEEAEEEEEEDDEFGEDEEVEEGEEGIVEEDDSDDEEGKENSSSEEEDDEDDEEDDEEEEEQDYMGSHPLFTLSTLAAINGIGSEDSMDVDTDAAASDAVLPGVASIFPDLIAPDASHAVA